jgi:superfamily II DNA helicase RecQ
MLFMLPARCSAGGLTVVVVPLVSLRSDIKGRCDELGIECVEWSGGRPHEWASVVLVTPESAVGESFGHFVNRQRAMGRLDRIVIDECHVVLDSGAGGSWRSRVLGLRGLVRAETQLVYLTATLRPADEAEFGRLVGLPADGARWFRSATTRTNVRYQVRRYKTPDETEEVVLAALVEEKKEQYGRKGQIIVYCDTVKKTVRYGKTLGALCYHRGAGSADEKRGIVKQLTEGRHQVFTATNALGLGVDAPTIRVVIHVGVVRRLRDYAQESGRAGRDGLQSEAIILKAERYDRRGRPVEETAEQAEGRGVDREMWEFTQTRGCVRVVLDREMDGRTDRERCGDGEEPCHRCRAADEERRRQERLMEGLDERDTAEAAVERVTERIIERVTEKVTERAIERATEEAAETAAEADGGGRRDRGGGVLTTGQTTEADTEVETYRARVQRRMRGWDERIRQSKEVLEVERFAVMSEQWASGCTWCRATGEKEQVCGSRTIEECSGEDAGVVRDAVEMVKRELRYGLGLFRLRVAAGDV